MQLKLKYVMNYWERIEVPMKSTKGSAYSNDRICGITFGKF